MAPQEMPLKQQPAAREITASPGPHTGIPGKLGKELPRLIVKAPQFKLNGIMWSENAGSRLAVVNGLIVREGGFIRGVEVTHINKDYVELTSGDGMEKYRLTIRYP